MRLLGGFTARMLLGAWQVPWMRGWLAWGRKGPRRGGAIRGLPVLGALVLLIAIAASLILALSESLARLGVELHFVRRELARR